MIRQRKIELLAPAKNLECGIAAIDHGADAVYIGGSKFGARAYADNPETDILLSAIDYVHSKDRRIYLTVNTLLKEQELEKEHQVVKDRVIVEKKAKLEELKDMLG